MSDLAEATETIEGYVVDVACIRRYPRAELSERARTHGRDCTMMGHCVESGYGLVDDAGRLALLNAEATPRVVDVARRTTTDQGIRLRATREWREGEMRTIRIEERNA